MAVQNDPRDRQWFAKCRDFASRRWRQLDRKWQIWSVCALLAFLSLGLLFVFSGRGTGPAVDAPVTTDEKPPPRNPSTLSAASDKGTAPNLSPQAPSKSPASQSPTEPAASPKPTTEVPAKPTAEPPRDGQRVPTGWVNIVNRKTGLTMPRGTVRIEPVGKFYKLRRLDGQYVAIENWALNGEKVHTRHNPGVLRLVADAGDRSTFWKIEPLGNGYWRIVNRETRQCLVPRNAKGHVVQAPSRKGALEQEWRFEPAKPEVPSEPQPAAEQPAKPETASKPKTGEADNEQQPAGGQANAGAKTPADSPPDSTQPSYVLWGLGVASLLALGWLVRRNWGHWPTRLRPQTILPPLLAQYSRCRETVQQQARRWFPKAISAVRRAAARVGKACARGWSALVHHVRPFIAYAAVRWQQLDRKSRTAGCILLALILLPLLFAVTGRRAEAPGPPVDNTGSQSAAKPPANTEAQSKPIMPPSVATSSEAAQPATAQLDVAKLVAAIDPAVVTIVCPDGLGSGFVVDRAGEIVTNYHVVEGATEATVIFPDKTRFPVKGFLACAPRKDLVLLKIGPGNRELPTLRVAAVAPAKGEKGYAFGAPMGLSGSVSDGIVASVRQLPEAQDEGYDTGFEVIQTTAPISPGNSGGPLVNTHGEVVGVNTLGSVIAQNVNFAISSSHVRDLMLKRSDRPRPLSDLPRRASRED